MSIDTVSGSHPFEVGSSYEREAVLQFLGSKQPMSGIVYGNEQRDYLAVFSGGRFGKRAGYTDGWDPEGIFRYCGQGSKGDQRLQGANEVLARHSGIVLIFETWKARNSWKGQQRFLGEFRVLGYDITTANGPRKGDKLLIFSLIPITLSVPPEPKTLITDRGELLKFRAKAIAASRNVAPARISKAEYRTRSEMVSCYVLIRAGDTCEACNSPAPFRRAEGTPYLETHHTRRVADDGPDDILHVAGICPNCHREAHFGPDPVGFQKRLEDKIAAKEAPYESGEIIPAL